MTRHRLKCEKKLSTNKSMQKLVSKNFYATEQVMVMFCQLCLEVINDSSFPVVKDILSFCLNLDLYKHLGFVKQVRCRTAYTWFRKLNIQTPVLKKKANEDVQNKFVKNYYDTFYPRSYVVYVITKGYKETNNNPMRWKKRYDEEFSNRKHALPPI